MSLEVEDRLELLAILASDADSMVAERASAALLGQPPEHFLKAVARPGAAPALFSYCAANLSGKPGIWDGMAKNPACPPEVLLKGTRNLTIEGVQALLDDLGRLASSPALVSALAACPAATIEQRDLLREMQKDSAPAQEIESAAKEVEPSVEKRQTFLQKVTQLTVLEKIKLALMGNREERIFLIRDPNKMVQRAVLQSPRLTDQEVESFATMTSLTSEVLRVIGAHRNFVKNYAVVRNLVGNSKTPIETTLHLLPRLTLQDLRLLTTNKNIPQLLRTTAIKLYKQRTEAR